MSDAEPRPGQQRLDAVRCPHCDQVTMPNRLADESIVCSCTAERALPLNLVRGTSRDGEAGGMPPPVDEAASSAAETPVTGMPADEARTAGARGRLPEDRGQFGRDMATEDYQPLRKPPER